MVTDFWLEFLANGKRDILSAAGLVRLELLTTGLVDPTPASTWADVEPFVADYPGYAAHVFDAADIADAVLDGDHWKSPCPTVTFEQIGTAADPVAVGWIAFVLADASGGGDPVDRLLHLTQVLPNPKFFAEDGDFMIVVHQLLTEACAGASVPAGDFRTPDGTDIRTVDGTDLRVY